ncbi:MAG: VOC family protein [Gammaproteobacteria bacterium]|nr:VOC family protein [Gammaproteobacteria bacterium]
MENIVVWFDLPVKDIQHAMKFYKEVLDIEMQEMEQGPTKVAFFPFAPGVASGALIEGPESKPSETGVMIYLNGGSDVSVPLGRVKAAGGTVVMEKTSIGEHGFSARFKDVDGNIVALHSPN